MKKLITIAVAAFIVLPACSAGRMPGNKFETKPFGWAVCTSLTSGDDYAMTGGGKGKTVTLKSNGSDMYESIVKAIKENDVIVLDGSAGRFILGKCMFFKNLKNKTIVGTNGAVIQTAFTITPEIRKALEAANLSQYSTASGTGGVLSNGQKVGEKQELMTRQTIIDLTGDQKETYRYAGIFQFESCENVIIRNLDLRGPGSVDVGAYDLLSITFGSNHFWVDHCSFTDGMDGNLDITFKADFVTVSWCVFKYTENSFSHPLSNLIAGSDHVSQGPDNLNVTYYACEWGPGVGGRTPMARFGTIHELNCYFNCPGKGGDRVNPRTDSEFLVENCYFVEGLPKNYIRGKSATYSAKSLNLKGNICKTPISVEEFGTVSIPYRYKTFPAENVPEAVSANAGPKLKKPLNF